MASIRQKKVFKKIGENGGKSLRKAMLEAGFSQKYADNPNRMTKTKSWEKLMEKYLPDKKLAKVHEQGLAAVKKEHELVEYDERGRPVYNSIEIEDFATRHKYLETAYKLKKKFPKEEHDITLHDYAGLIKAIERGSSEEESS